MSNYFISTEDRPYHLSVGAVVLNDRDEVLCHHFSDLTIDGQAAHDIYILVRETLEQGETLEHAVHRGLFEEAGVKAKIKTYLGSILSTFPRGAVVSEKTTVYFLCNLESMDQLHRDVNDPEAGSNLVFLPTDDLAEKMKTQRKRYHRTDLDETNILERVKKHLSISNSRE